MIKNSKINFKYYSSAKSKVMDRVSVELDMDILEWKKLKPMLLHNHTIKHNRRKGESGEEENNK